MKWRSVWIKVGIGVGAVLLGVLVVAAVAYHEWAKPIGSGSVVDEAQAAGYTADRFPHAGDPYFHDMDNGAAVNDKGRDMWIVWTGGDDRFWDAMTVASLGVFDLLKTVTSDPNQTQGVGGAPYTRD